MRELGLTAPDDWAVIGFDESEYAEMFTPTLTTLTADAEGHGRLAARRALGLDTSDVKIRIGRVIPASPRRDRPQTEALGDGGTRTDPW